MDIFKPGLYKYGTDELVASWSDLMKTAHKIEADSDLPFYCVNFKDCMFELKLVDGEPLTFKVPYAFDLAKEAFMHEGFFRECLNIKEIDAAIDVFTSYNFSDVEDLESIKIINSPMPDMNKALDLYGFGSKARFVNCHKFKNVFFDEKFKIGKSYNGIACYEENLVFVPPANDYNNLPPEVKVCLEGAIANPSETFIIPKQIKKAIGMPWSKLAYFPKEAFFHEYLDIDFPALREFEIDERKKVFFEGLRRSTKVYCYPGSNIERLFRENHVKTYSPTLDNLIDEGKSMVEINEILKTQEER